MRWLKFLYDWTISLADKPYSIWALFGIAVIESSVFPIPPDVLLIALALGKPSQAFWQASVCTVGSVLGALIGYLIGFAFWQAVGDFFFRYVPGFTREVFEQVCQSYEQHSVFIVFTAAFTPIPYKVITITAGVTQISIVPFIVVSIVGRGSRFFLIAGLLKIFGEKIKIFIDKYFNILTVLVVIIYFLAFYLIPYLFK